ncbi:MAG TPA: glycosyltransferase family 2 protein [Verrucomicrobiae bacterium]|nr:glycosyltransferase family 2 protein [Verrucomicrobiae bacterium]
MSETVELTIRMPCLNEAETLTRCIEKAKVGIQRAGVRGEILIADNGSTDGSQAIAEKLGARVVAVKAKGYGNVLRGGIEAARGEWILMGDADDTMHGGQWNRSNAGLQAHLPASFCCDWLRNILREPGAAVDAGSQPGGVLSSSQF